MASTKNGLPMNLTNNTGYWKCNGLWYYT